LIFIIVRDLAGRTKKPKKQPKKYQTIIPSVTQALKHIGTNGAPQEFLQLSGAHWSQEPTKQLLSLSRIKKPS